MKKHRASVVMLARTVQCLMCVCAPRYALLPVSGVDLSVLLSLESQRIGQHGRAQVHGLGKIARESSIHGQCALFCDVVTPASEVPAKSQTVLRESLGPIAGRLLACFDYEWSLFDHVSRASADQVFNLGRWAEGGCTPGPKRKAPGRAHQ